MSRPIIAIITPDDADRIGRFLAIMCEVSDVGENEQVPLRLVSDALMALGNDTDAIVTAPGPFTDEARLVPLMAEALHYQRAAFEDDEPVNGADLVDWFAEWRGRLSEALNAPHPAYTIVTGPELRDTLGYSLMHSARMAFEGEGDGHGYLTAWHMIDGINDLLGQLEFHPVPLPAEPDTTPETFVDEQLGNEMRRALSGFDWMPR